jgi:hypothetical protein
MKLKEKRLDHFAAEFWAWNDKEEREDPEGYILRMQTERHQRQLKSALRFFRVVWGREALDAFLREYLDRDEERSAKLQNESGSELVEGS